MNEPILPSLFIETRCELAKQLSEAALDHEAFEKPVPVCDLVKCRATCCHDGVILSNEEADAFQELGASDGLISLPNGGWKTRTVEAKNSELAEDFPKHFPKSRCVFLDDQHRCQWQLRAVEEGKHPWYYKPTSCWLHPVLIERRGGRPLITIRSRVGDEEDFATHTPCGREEDGAAPAWQSLEMELKMLGEIGGRDFYSQMKAPPGFSAAAKERSSG